MTRGAAAAEAALGFRADISFLGVTGVHPQAGMTTGDCDEAAMKRTLAGCAADTYVLASSEKIGVASPFTVLPFADIGGITTDTPLHHPVLQQLTRDGVAIIGPSG